MAWYWTSASFVTGQHLNHLKWGIAKVNSQMMTSQCTSNVSWHTMTSKLLSLSQRYWPVGFFESLSIPVAHITRSTGWTLSDKSVLPKWDFQQAYFYLANQHKCTCRPDGPNHLNITSVLLLKYPYGRTAMRLYCNTVTNTKKNPSKKQQCKNFFSRGSQVKKHQHSHSRPHKKNALVYPVQNKLLWSTNILPFNRHMVKFLDNSE